ncbi:undecaprenyl-diphosphate phosphatase, partial [uncultured Porphyromonas sp.]|uniref:undecaprenyl-diphosphate phosphatase n=1 Tax=uncultured Porphyromonas sp. TaxID=159274 RepID=UPI0028046782
NELLVGNVVAFVVALLAIKFFINYVTRYGFKLFGYYRIVVGLLVLILLLCGVPLAMH